MRSFILGFGSLLVLATTAHAQPPSETPVIQPLTQPGSASDGESRSEVGAVALAVGGSLAGPALITAAFLNGDNTAPYHSAVWPMMATGCAFTVLGPSLGNWYAGKGLSKGLAVRLLGAAVVGAGGALFVTSLFDSGPGALIGLGIGAGGLGTMLVGTVMDVVEAPQAVADYNHRHQLSIAPMITRTPTGQQTGLSIGGVF